MRNGGPATGPGGRRDRRGQSITLDYTLSLAVGFLLITGLIIAGGDYVTDQRNRAQQSELRVVGQQVAADIEAADRLVVSATTNADVRLDRQLPETVARSGYTIQVVEDDDPYLVLASDGSAVSVRVDLVNQTALVPTTIAGGRVVVEYTGGKLELEPGDRYA